MIRVSVSRITGRVVVGLNDDSAPANQSLELHSLEALDALISALHEIRDAFDGA